jgi:hypothetical protein
MNKIKISQSVAGKTIALVLGVLTMVFLISAIVQAWTEPSKTPPEGNVPAPINVSSNAQTKEGSLTIGDVFTIAGGGGESLVIRNGGDVKIYNANNSGSVLFYCDTDGQLTIPRNLKVGDTGTFDCINLGGVTKCSWPSGGNGGNGGNGGVGYWTQSDSSLYPNDNDWYVGIGTTDPGENKLRVVYSGLGSAIYASNDWGWAAVRGDAENGAGLYGLSTDGYGLYAASTNGYGVFGASSKGWAGYFQGDVYIDEDVGIGTTIPTERVDAVGYVKGRTGLCIGDDCRTEWPEGGDGVGYWTQSDSSLYPNSTNWRVAVGTTTPDSDSDVHIKDENDYTNLVLESTGANYFPLIKMRNDYGNWQIWASDDDFVIRRNGVETAIFADGEIGVVGINTDNPKQRLTINGDVGIWDAEELYFYTGQGASRIGYVGPGRNDDLSLVSQANGKWLRIGSENANITFWANGNVYSDDNPQMVIQPSGEVGIGIGDPTQKLDVDGFVKGRTGLCIGDDCRTEWPEGDGGIVCSDCDPRFVNEWETWNSDLTVTGNIRLGNVAGGGDKRLFLTSESGAHYITANNWWTQFISHDNEGWEFKDANSTSVKFNTDGPYSFYGNVEIKGDITEVDEICLDNGCRRDWPSGDGVDGDITAVYADDGLTGGAT